MNSHNSLIFQNKNGKKQSRKIILKKLNLLENLANSLEVSNSELKQANEKLTAKAELLAQINSKTMLTSLQNTKEIDAIKEQIGGAK